MRALISNAVINTTRDLAKNIQDSVVGALIENIVLTTARNEIEILDLEGKLCKGRRINDYVCRWRPVEFLPGERLHAGLTGILTDLSLEHPKDQFLEILEGGVGHQHSVFKVSAPSMRPTYLFRKPHPKRIIVSYTAENPYTYEPEDPRLAWTKRFPFGRPMPSEVSFSLKCPKGLPFLYEPKAFKIDHLAKAESVRTDLSIQESKYWDRIHSSSHESDLQVSPCRTSFLWRIRPPRVNVGYQIVWQWKESGGDK